MFEVSWGFFAQALCGMYALRPFKLAFFIVISGEHDEPWGQQWREWADAGVDRGFFSFLESPLSVHYIRNGVDELFGMYI